jgi:hypothetical protein
MPKTKTKSEVDVPYVLSELETTTQELEALTALAKILNEKLDHAVSDLDSIRAALLGAQATLEKAERSR